MFIPIVLCIMFLSTCLNIVYIFRIIPSCCCHILLFPHISFHPKYGIHFIKGNPESVIVISLLLYTCSLSPCLLHTRVFSLLLKTLPLSVFHFHCLCTHLTTAVHGTPASRSSYSHCIPQTSY